MVRMSDSTSPRQIIFIMTDTQRTDMLGCYGYPDMKTPSLDRLASGGVRFDRAYTCQPVCGPARSALFTGIYPHSNGAWGNSMAIGDNVRTVGQRLSDHGFPAAYIGKWHVDGGDYFGLGRCPAGWDPERWYDMRCYLEELTPEERRRSRRPETTRNPGVSADFTFGHRVSNRAIDFLSQSVGEDFFLVVSYDEPHHPFLSPEPYASMYRGYEMPKKSNVWDTLADKPAHHRAWAGKMLEEDKDALRIAPSDFLGCNSFVDSEIGRVLDAAAAHAPGALVVYASDHGDMLHSHSLDGKGAAMYEEITHIPLLARWPGHIPEGSTCGMPVSLIDIVPTILDVAGLEAPPILQGESIKPLLEQPQTQTRRPVFMEFGRYEIDHDGFGGFQPIRSIFDGRYKLVVNLLTSDELYDLESDPDEMRNLIASPEHAHTRDALHDELLEWMNRTRDPFRGYYWERRPWRSDAAEATWGYTGMTRQREEEDYEPRQLDYDTGMEMTEAVRSKQAP